MKAAGWDDEEWGFASKALFLQDFLKWEKETYQACKQNRAYVECEAAKQIMFDRAERNGKSNYYSPYLTNAEREKLDKENEAWLW